MTQDPEMLADLRPDLEENDIQVVNGVRHDPQRIPQFVADAAREAPEDRHSLFAYELFLRLLQLRQCQAQLAGAALHPLLELLARRSKLSGHVIERPRQTPQLTLARLIHAAAEIAARDGLGGQRHLPDGSRERSTEAPRRPRRQAEHEEPGAGG